jgi:uncharacterized damage-inducible protein DinB
MKLATLSFALAALVAAAVHAEAHSSGHVLRQDVVHTLSSTEKKLVDLAEAIPADKFAYRPAEGVRSTAELLLHIAGANYFLTSFMGAKMPEGMSQNFDKSTTDKNKIVAELKKSFDHARKAVEAIPDADMTKPVKMFGHDSHMQTAMLILSNHVHEHLGQAIAYARASGVTPPWSKGKGD